MWCVDTDIKGTKMIAVINCCLNMIFQDDLRLLSCFKYTLKNEIEAPSIEPTTSKHWLLNQRRVIVGPAS